MRIFGTVTVILSLLLALTAFSGCGGSDSPTDSTPPDDTNSPPSKPKVVYPQWESEGQSTRPTLIWECYDPDFDDLTFYWSITTYPTASTVYSGETTEDSYVWGEGETALATETEYVWSVTADDGTNDPVEGNPRTFTTGSSTNNPPVKPYYCFPHPGNTNIDADDLTLSWYCYDPDGDPIVYDVYFGAVPVEELVSEGQSEKSYNVGALEHTTRYHWWIKARDDQGGSANTHSMLFTTEEVNIPPTEPVNVSPIDEEPEAELDATLSWTCSDPDGDPDAYLTYDVWFGPRLMELPIATGIRETTVKPEGMRKNIEYWWRVIACDNDGGETYSPWWKFTTVDATYVELEVIRNISNYYGTVTHDDMIRARFDAAYAPGLAIEPLQPAGVTAGAYTLTWLDYEQFYFYRDPQNEPFLTLGSSYTFNVTSGGNVDFLTAVADMPDCEHYFTSPDMNTGISLDDGFTVEWHSNCPGTGNVDIYVRNGMGEDVGIHIHTTNDGSYTFTRTELYPVTGYFEIFVDIIAEEKNLIDESGFYWRSFVRGKITCTLMLYVM